MLRVSDSKILCALIFVFGALLFGCKDIEREYYPDGSLMRKYEINSKGEVDGSYKAFHPNGKLRRIGNFKNDSEDGEFKLFYETGELEQVLTYKNGKINGIQLEYYKNGILKSKVEYANNKLNGEYQSFHQNGELEMYAINNNDKTEYYEEYDETGKLIKEARRIQTKGTNGDTINLGDEYKFKVISSGRIPPNMDKIIFRCILRNIAGKVNHDSLGNYNYELIKHITEPDYYHFNIISKQGQVIVNDNINKKFVFQEEVILQPDNSFLHIITPVESGLQVLLCEFEISNEKDNTKFITPFQLVFYVGENNKIAKLGSVLNNR